MQILHQIKIETVHNLKIESVDDSLFLNWKSQTGLDSYNFIFSKKKKKKICFKVVSEEKND